MDIELFEKLNQFNKYTFFEDSHTYLYNNEKVGKSVTQVVSDYVPKFDGGYWLPKKAKSLHISEEELKKQWERKAEISTRTGTLLHRYIELLLQGKIQIPTTDDKDVTERLNGLIPLANAFIGGIKQEMIPIKSEFIVGIENKIAGQIDQIFYNPKDGKLYIYDWKTNKDISFWNQYEKLLPPFNFLDSCEINKYSLQLSLYKYILSIYNIPIEGLFIVWFNENNKRAVMYPCKDLTKYCDKIIEKL